MAKDSDFRFRWERTFRAAEIAKRHTRGSLTAAVGFAFSTYADPDGTNVKPSLQRIAKGLGVNRTGVSDARDNLTREGWLTVTVQADKHQGRHVTEYRLSIPPQYLPHGALANDGGAGMPQGVGTDATGGGHPRHTTKSETRTATTSLTNTDNQDKKNPWVFDDDEEDNKPGPAMPGRPITVKDDDDDGPVVDEYGVPAPAPWDEDDDSEPPTAAAWASDESLTGTSADASSADDLSADALSRSERWELERQRRKEKREAEKSQRHVPYWRRD